MKTKNFVILGLLVIGVLVGNGCASMREGEGYFEAYTPVLGQGASNSHFIFDNRSHNILEIVINGKTLVWHKTNKPRQVGPWGTFRISLGTAFTGGSCSIIVRMWDPSHSRVVYSSSQGFPLYTRGGDITTTWTFWTGKDHWETVYGYGGFGGFGYW